MASPQQPEILRKGSILMLALLVCLSITFSDAAPFNIVTITPGGVTQGSLYSNVTIYGARIGHQAFLMLKKDTYGTQEFNCTIPPSYESKMRTPVATVRVGGETNFYVRGLVPGSYIICYKNTTNVTLAGPNNTNYQPPVHPAHRGFVALQPTVSVAYSKIDAEKSSVCCSGPFVAGERATCTITALDSEGRITGTADDACQFNLCPLRDGRGDDIKYITRPYFIKTGEYRFHFVPTGSGCQGVAGVGLDGMSLSNKYAFFKVQPNPFINVTKATSECVVDNQESLDSTCYIVQRDKFGNPVKRCSMDPEGPVHCSRIIH